MLSHREARPTDGSAGSSPAGAMGRAPLVDFCNRIDLRARPSERSNPAHRTGSRPPAQLFSRVAALDPVRDRSLSEASRWSAASREFTGQGLVARVLSPRIALSASHRDRSRRKLCPNPIDPDTSCRKLVTAQAGVSRVAEASFPSAPFYEPARRLPLSRLAPIG